MLLKQLSVLMRTILTASIRMMDASRLRLSVSKSFPESLDNEPLAHPVSHCVTDDLLGTEILDPCQIQPSFICLDIGDVRSIDHAWFGDLKVLLQ